MGDLIINEATNLDLEDYEYDQDQAEERLNIQLTPQSQVFPQQKFLANDLLRRVIYVQGERLKTYKKLDFQVSKSTYSSTYYVPI